MQRLIGRYGGTHPGPAVLICGALHGNEHAGVSAAQRVMEQLERERPPVRGEVIAVVGNLQALEKGRRFLSVDLNRCWGDGCAAPPGSPEEAEQRELIEIIEAIPGPLVVLDLHTTSGRSPPFTIMSDALRNRRIAFALPGPVLLGLEESIDGTMLAYVTERGHTAVVVEAGQHDDPNSVEIHEAVIWLGLAAAGVVEPDGTRFRDRMRAATRGLPRVVELRIRHEVSARNGFSVLPGLEGFQKVETGDLVAHDAGGEIRCTESGRIVMPLYQEQGDEGFFIVRSVSRFRLMLSAFLRHLRLSVFLRLLPGVRRHPDLPNALRVHPRIARWFVVEIFHLFGFRRRREDGAWLVFSRRTLG